MTAGQKSSEGICVCMYYYNELFPNGQKGVN